MNQEWTGTELDRLKCIMGQEFATIAPISTGKGQADAPESEKKNTQTHQYSNETVPQGSKFRIIFLQILQKLILRGVVRGKRNGQLRIGTCGDRETGPGDARMRCDGTS